MERTVLRRWVISLMTACCALLVNAGIAAGADEYIFDSELSLTGTCVVSPDDPTPDPPIADCESGDHPAVAFDKPRGFATDSHGNMYVSIAEGKPGRIAIFDSTGFFITEVETADEVFTVAVDSEGFLYVRSRPGSQAALLRFTPTLYNPAAGEIEYGDPPVEILDQFLEEEGEPTLELPPPTSGTVVKPNDHLLVHYENQIVEFSSAKEGNKRLGSIGLGTIKGGKWIALDVSRNRLYSSYFEGVSNKKQLLVFELEAPHALLETVSGAETPDGKFSGAELPMAVDEATGNLFVYDGLKNRVFQFNEDYEYEATIEHSFNSPEPPAVAFDNSPLSENYGYLFVTSGKAGTKLAPSHSYAFGPPDPGPPVVETIGFHGVSETEAIVSARINPEGAETEYFIEYTANEDFESGATVAGKGVLPAGKDGIDVSASLTGLTPGTTYLFRVVAENEFEESKKGVDEKQGSFNTYPEQPPFAACLSDPVRVGLAALLPDCRAYELVTPPDTNGRSPTGAAGSGVFFPMLQASPSGDKASFLISQGTLPGHEGTGAFNGQNYVASRGEEGWESVIIGPNGSESISPLPGGISPDQEFAFWATGKNEEGTAVVNNESTTYLRYPDGHSELVGRGELGPDPQVAGQLISENGTHVIFITRNSGTHEAVRLEENAPPDGTEVVYDRTRDPVTGEEETHVVSLLPEDETPADGEDALFEGATYDGEAVAFSIGSTLYLRLHNEETFKIAEGATYAGLGKDGTRVFYVKGGNLFAYDVKEEAEIPFTNSGGITVVNVSEGGTRAYFVSNSVLVGEPNPEGDLPKAKEPNLYLSEEGLLSFVGTVTKRDVEGAPVPGAGMQRGLGLWVDGLEFDTPGRNPSRTTPNGDTLLFEARTDLTDFKSEEIAQVYRYDLSEFSLECLSCNPTGTKPTTDATLQSLSVMEFDAPIGGTTRLLNIRPTGDRAFFQSSEPLVVDDTDGLQDVYEWEKQGVGSCDTPGGCTYLISSGQSAKDHDYLFAVSADGDDVFFVSADKLLPSDPETTRSIYDARVGGGFPEQNPPVCQSEACWPAPTPPPQFPMLGTKTVSPGSPAARTCPKGKRKVKRNGKIVCVKKKKKHHKKHKQQKQSNRSGAGK